MNELALENITKTKCLECGDNLTSWETTGYCIICEPDEYDI
jgi:RNA polymerase subunit RPABC4/transcription elongation factor Spt4